MNKKCNDFFHKNAFENVCKLAGSFTENRESACSQFVVMTTSDAICDDKVGWWLSVPHYVQWRHNGRDGVSYHQPHHCLLNRLFRRRSKKTSKPRVTVLRAGNSPVTGEFPAQMASNAENVSIWWRHHVNLACRPLALVHTRSRIPARTRTASHCTVWVLAENCPETRPWSPDPALTHQRR